MHITIQAANEAHFQYAEAICSLIEVSAQQRGTGIARRSPDYIRTKMQNGNAVIALSRNQLAGFCYIEVWSHGRYVANSGLIVAHDFRKQGLAKKIKAKAFNLAREKYPQAKVFGITTSLPVMKINSELGYKPVTFSELTQDEAFWNGCQSCPNYDILERNERHMCLCTGMLAPSKAEEVLTRVVMDAVHEDQTPITLKKNNGVGALWRKKNILRNIFTTQKNEK